MQPHEQDPRRPSGIPAQLHFAPVRIRGSFQSPSGRTGTMEGSFRCERVVHRAGELAAEGMFSGTLVEVDGTRIGSASRWQAVPARTVDPHRRSTVAIGPVEVDLLGLTVTVPATTISGTTRSQ